MFQLYILKTLATYQASINDSHLKNHVHNIRKNIFSINRTCAFSNKGIHVSPFHIAVKTFENSKLQGFPSHEFYAFQASRA